MLFISGGLSIRNSLVDTIDLVVGFFKGINSVFEEGLSIDNSLSVLDSSGCVISNLLGQEWDLGVAYASDFGVVDILSGLLSVEVNN